jgi:DNA polymerase-1
MSTTLYVIDGNSVHHWLWHGTAKDDRGNELPLGVKVAKWWGHFYSVVKPTHVAVCIDGKGNWRKEIHAEYKSTRKAKPEDPELIAALRAMPEDWKTWGVPTFEVAGFEADDAIASIINVHAGEECEVVIVSSDKDLMCLVGDHVKQYDPRPDKNGNYTLYDALAVEAKLGVPPHRVPDLLALMGDASDDVPGVEGWGRVSAINAVKQTSSMLEIIRKAHAGELRDINEKLQRRVHAKDELDKHGQPKQKQTPLTEQLAELELSQQLVALRYDVPIPAELDAYLLPPSYQLAPPPDGALKPRPAPQPEPEAFDVNAIPF